MFRSYENYKNNKGESLRALRERPSEEVQDTCVVLFHGRSVDKDELGTFVALSDALIDAWYDVFRFDFRGQGQSDGEFTSLSSNKEDIRTTLAYLKKEKKYTSYVFVAASFAGMSVLSILSKIEEKVKWLILRNALVDIDYVKHPVSIIWKEKWEKREKMVDKTWYMKFDRRVVMTKSAYEEMLQANPWEAFESLKLPIVMIHGTEDTNVPYELSKKYAEKYGNIKLHTIEWWKHGFPRWYGLDEAVETCVKSIQNL